jgi:hypothetical protein
MIPTTMLLDLFIKFWSLVTSVWNERYISKSSGSLQKIFPYSNTKIPCAKGPSVLRVVDYFRAMSLVAHANFELRYLNYDSFNIEIVPCILTTFNGDVLFELPPLVSLGGHFGQMQGMDRKHDGHVWYKAKTTNIKNNVNLNF